MTENSVQTQSVSKRLGLDIVVNPSTVVAGENTTGKVSFPGDSGDLNINIDNPVDAQLSSHHSENDTSEGNLIRKPGKVGQGVTIYLSSDRPSVTVPASIFIDTSGEHPDVVGWRWSSTFQIQTSPVAVDTLVTISASDRQGSTVSTTLTVKASVTNLTVDVDAQANIFGAGHNFLPNPGGGGAGVAPPIVQFPASAGKVLTFSNITGQISCCGGGSAFNGPDGGTFAGGNTNINPTNGISGIINHQKTMFLVGVFLNDAEPNDPAPPSLDFSSSPLGENFMTLEPQLNQLFFIGDGKTERGDTQQFEVPASASRLFLGFVDGWNFQGNPGHYHDNVGSLTVNLKITGRRIPQWTSAYYDGWQQRNGVLNPNDIDYSAVTHVIHFAVKPLDNGELGQDPDYYPLTPETSAELLKAAHAKGVKVLFSVGGEETHTQFRNATKPEYVATFITNLVKFMTNNSEGYEGEKYDGIDIDWEPLQDNDEYQYIQFITLLRDKLNELNLQNPPLLTAAVKEQPAVFAQLQNQFDQINIMTYDLAGNWDEYRVTWHDAAVYDGDFPRPHEGRFPSADSLVKAFKNAGVPARKLGIGIVFHGKQWRPVTQLLEKWSPDNPPQVEGLPYSEIVSKYYPNGVYHWDSQAQAAYLSHDGWRLTDKYFISYDDETSIQAKIDYLSQNGLGGVIIWELAGGWLPSGTTVRDPLLKAVKNATRWVPI